MRPTLLLDLDGTLIDTLPDLLASLNRVTAGDYTLAEVRPWVGDGATVLLQRALAARGRHATAQELNALVQDYVRQMSSASVPYPGAVDALAVLVAEGWLLAVCTNKPERAARDLLAATGLLPYLAATGGGDSFPTRKPDPAHVLSTLAAAGGDPAAAIMVGDHQNDILAAAGAGIPSIFVSWGYGDNASGATATAESFAALPGIARQLSRSNTTTPHQRTGSGS